MERQSVLHQSLKVLWSVMETAAAVRAGLATFMVVNSVSHDWTYSVFTVVVIEGVFVSSLFLIGVDVVAPISALVALAFSGVMQYCEILVVDGALTESERAVLRIAIAFAPIVILSLAYLRHLVVPTSGQGVKVQFPFLDLKRVLGLNHGELAGDSIKSNGGGSVAARSLNISVRKVKGDSSVALKRKRV